MRRRARGSVKSSSPPTRTVPRWGRSSPASARRSVDLPEPFGPKTARAPPAGTSRETPRSTRSRPNPRQTSRAATAAWAAGETDAAAESSAAAFTFARASGTAEIRHERRDLVGVEEEERIAAELDHVLGRRLRVEGRELRFDAGDLGRERLGQQGVHFPDPLCRRAPLAARTHRLDLANQPPFLVDEAPLRFPGRGKVPVGVVPEIHETALERVPLPRRIALPAERQVERRGGDRVGR